MSSPLRTDNVEQADFIYVPLFWLIYKESLMQPFMDNATSYLPLLGQKPHVVVLARPRHEHVKNHDPVVCVVLQCCCCCCCFCLAICIYLFKGGWWGYCSAL